ncbi:MAG TPA: transglutaminase family protein [Candidatus Margulisiibacteriota bacterium]|nr:transglutaminase family protein [Candidatus Margulisiibacteriota bacterium]
MRYVIDHETRLTFAQPVREHQCELRLAPSDSSVQRVQGVSIEVEPTARLDRYVDYFGNQVHHFDVVNPHSRLVTRLHATVETLLGNPFDFPLVPPQRERDWIADTLKAQPRLWDYVLSFSPLTPDLNRTELPGLEAPTHSPARRILDSVLAAAEWITGTLEYRPGATRVHSILEEVWRARAGVCQDFAHLLIAVVRSWDVPARYVMGYQDPECAEDGAAPAPHAWAEVLIPGAGWRGFDPTASLVVNDRYVVVAVGRDSLDAAPQRGSFKGEESGEEPEVTLQIACEEQGQQ